MYSNILFTLATKYTCIDAPYGFIIFTDKLFDEVNLKSVNDPLLRSNNTPIKFTINSIILIYY